MRTDSSICVSIQNTVDIRRHHAINLHKLRQQNLDRFCNLQTLGLPNHTSQRDLHATSHHRGTLLIHHPIHRKIRVVINRRNHCVTLRNLEAALCEVNGCTSGQNGEAWDLAERTSTVGACARATPSCFRGSLAAARGHHGRCRKVAAPGIATAIAMASLQQNKRLAIAVFSSFEIPAGVSLRVWVAKLSGNMLRIFNHPVPEPR